MACCGRPIEILEAVIGGANINAMDDWNRGTALHHAAYFGNAPAVKLLLSSGADVNSVHWLAGTPLMAASEQDDLGAFIQLLVCFGI